MLGLPTFHFEGEYGLCKRSIVCRKKLSIHVSRSETATPSYDIEADPRVRYIRHRYVNHATTGFKSDVSMHYALCLLHVLLLVDTRSAVAVRALGLFEIDRITILDRRSMKLFLENGISFDSFELALEIADVRATIGATTGVGKAISVILHLVSGTAPDVIRGEQRA